MKTITTDLPDLPPGSIQEALSNYALNIEELSLRVSILEATAGSRYTIKYRNGRMLEVREITAKDYKDAFEQHIIYIRYLNLTSEGNRYVKVGNPELLEIKPRLLLAEILKKREILEQSVA